MSNEQTAAELSAAAAQGKWEAGTFGEYGGDYLATVPTHIGGDRKMIVTGISLADAKFVAALVNEHREKSDASGK